MKFSRFLHNFITFLFLQGTNYTNTKTNIRSSLDITKSSHLQNESFQISLFTIRLIVSMSNNLGMKITKFLFICINFKFRNHEN